MDDQQQSVRPTRSHPMQICSGGRLLRTSPDDWSRSSVLPPGAEPGVKSAAFA
jgi:hypothetical protein